jgi:hypothetical protein
MAGSGLFGSGQALGWLARAFKRGAAPPARRAAAAAAAPPEPRVVAAEPAPPEPVLAFGKGFSAEGEQGRWVGPVGFLTVPAEALPGQVSLELGRGQLAADAAFAVEAYRAEQRIAVVTFAPGDQSHRLDLQVEGAEGGVEVRLECVDASGPLPPDARHPPLCLKSWGMRPLTQFTACPVCHQPRWQARRWFGSLPSGTRRGLRRYDLVGCPECELIHLSPLPAKAALDEIYLEGVQFTSDCYTGPRADLVKEFILCRLRALLGWVRPGEEPVRVLEIGAGLAWMCGGAKTLDPRATTVAQDISTEGCEKCPWVDHFLVGELEERLPGIESHGPYHVISMTHVIEHLPDPVAVLRICRPLLARRGLVFVTAPYRPKGWAPESPLSVWEQWSYNHVPGHLQYFNDTSMRRCAERAGLRVEYFDQTADDHQALEAWIRLPR